MDEQRVQRTSDETITRWAFDPPVVAVERYTTGRTVAIRSAVRAVRHGGDTTWQFRGVPLSKHGKPVGGISVRFLTGDDEARLIAIVEASGEDERRG